MAWFGAKATNHLWNGRSASYLKHILVLPDAGQDDVDEDGQEGVAHDKTMAKSIMYAITAGSTQAVALSGFSV